MLALLLISAFLCSPGPPPETPENTRARLAEVTSSAPSVAPDQAIAALEQALADLRNAPEHASRETPEVVLEAQVTLTRLYIAVGDEPAAAHAMDRLLLIDSEGRAPINAFGPSITQLHQQRLEILEAQGKATLSVDCRVECDIVVNHRELDDPRLELYLAEHDVWVRARDGTPPWQHHSVVLDVADTTRTLVFDPRPDIAARVSAPPLSAPSLAITPIPRPRRLFPRMTSIVVLAASATLLATGSLLLALHDRCRSNGLIDYRELDSPTDCSAIYQTAVPGALLAIAGAGFVPTFAVILTIDETRTRRARTARAVFSLSLRF